jgi:oligopeptide transport system substrate-binding protein
MIFKKTVAVLLAACLLFSVSGCKKHGPSNGDKQINYSLLGDPKTLDPQIASDSDSVTVVNALYEGLARLDAKGAAQPGAAEKWESGADGAEFTFTLRKGAKWSDGTPLTADDFVYAFQRALDPRTGSAACSPMFCIKNARQVHSGKMKPNQLGVSASDNRTLTVRLEYSCPDFPTLTALPVFMPCNEKFFVSTSGRYGLENKYVLGNGPFEIDGIYGWDHGKSLNLKRADEYSGSTKPLPSNVDFDLTGKIFADQGAAPVTSEEADKNSADPVAALKSGAVDAAPLSSEEANDAKAAGCTLESLQDATWGLCFNTQSSPMKNRKIRTAFLQAFSREKVLSHLSSDTAAADNILLPSTEFSGQDYRSLAGGSSSYLHQDKNSTQTLAQGLSELGLSGMASVTVLCPDDSNAKLMLNEMIIAWNAKFSNYFNMEALSETELKSRVRSGDYQIALCPLTPDGPGPSGILAQFRSGAAGNPAGLKDAVYDALLSKAETQSGKAGAQLYAQAEKYLNQQAVFYPIYYGRHYFALAKGVSGIAIHSFQGSIDFINAGKEQ